MIKFFIFCLNNEASYLIQNKRVINGYFFFILRLWWFLKINKQNDKININTHLRNNYEQRVNRIFNLYNLERDCIIISIFIHKSVPVLSEYYSIIWNDPGGTLSGRKGSLPSMLGAISKLRQRDIKTVSFVILRKVSSCLAQKRLERSLR